MTSMADSIKKNTLIGVFIALSTYLYPIATYPYVTRILGPVGLGKVTFVASFVGYFVLLAQLGMPNYGLRTCAIVKDDKSSLQKIIAELFIIHVITAFLTIILYGAVVFMILPFKDEPVLFLLYGFSLALSVLDCQWVYKATARFTFLALVNSLFRLLAIVAVFLLVRKPEDLYWYAIISILAGSGSFVAVFLSLKSQLGVSPLKECWCILNHDKFFLVLSRHIRPLLLFFMMSCAVTVYSSTDSVMLGFMRGDSAVGIYRVAVIVKTLLIVLTGALWQVALPFSACLWNSGNKEGFCKLGEISLCVISSASLPLTVFFILFAEPCVRIFAGETFIAAVYPMQILLLSVISIGVSNIIGGQLLIPIGQERLLFRAELSGVFCNIAGNVFLIPVYGVAGAALATLLSETLVATVAFAYIRRFIPLRLADRMNLVKSLLACCTALFTAYVIFSLPILNFDLTVTFAFIMPSTMLLLLQVALAFVAYAVIYLFVMYYFLKDKFVRGLIMRL